MKCLTFIRHAESLREAGPPRTLMHAMGEFVQRSLRSGVLVAWYARQSSSSDPLQGRAHRGALCLFSGSGPPPYCTAGVAQRIDQQPERR
jgi:hypothetical protein